MRQFTRLFTILLLVICSDAVLKKHHGIPLQPKTTSITRLEHTVIPQNYKIDLTVTEEQIISGNFTGKVLILINVAKNVTQFKIHMKDITIVDVRLSGNGYNGYLVAAPEGPDESDLLTLTSNTTIVAATYYLLAINYEGILSKTDMNGFYQSTYVDTENKTHYLAATQFEPMGARRAFPCFDEPEFKATFGITITHTHTYRALYNKGPLPTTRTEEGTKTTIFQTTPKTSTYLLAFIVSEFICAGGPATENQISTEVCGRVSTESTMDLALETAPKVLNEMNHYTGFNYTKMGIGKMSLAAIPDFTAGSMGNWGMVTCRESDILWDPYESSESYKQTVVAVITHEFAHQWFGDKVTLDWWSDVFLSEGFATYFEYHAAENLDVARDWQLTKQFVVDQLQTVLLTDSVNTSLPLSYATNDPEVINSRFDDISYNKGGSILRMVHHLLGLEDFKEGLTRYLNLSDTGTPEHLWNFLNPYQSELYSDKIPVPLQAIMNNWTHKAGYPCLTVTLEEESGNITITQARFLISGEDEDNTEWYVPITYTTSNSSDFYNTATKAWLVPEENLTLSLNGTEWIILNNQQVGYYRVNYDDKLLEKISTLLQSDRQGEVDEISRAQIVDDQFNFVRSGLKSLGDVLIFLGFLEKDSSYYTWSSAFKGYSYLLKRTSKKNIKDSLNAYILGQMGALLKSVNGESEVHTYILKQVKAKTWACKLGQEGCIADSKKKFDDFYINSTKKVDRNLRSYVYCYGLRNSDDAAGAFQFLYDQYIDSNLATEKLTILKALGCVSDSALRIQYLGKALTKEVRLQDVSHVFSSVYSYGPEGVDDVLTFISTNYSQFEEHFGTKSTLTSLIRSVADVITTQDQIDKLTDFANTDGLEASIKDTCTGAAESATNNLKVVASLEETLAEYFYLKQHSNAVINDYNVINAVFTLVAYLTFNL